MGIFDALFHRPDINAAVDEYRNTPGAYLIDVRTGKISNWPQGKTASFRTVKIVDTGEYTLLNAEKKRICGYTGYVPECLSIEEKGWGDYLEFEVGSNGIIHNWKFGQNEIEEFMENIR